MLIGHVMWLSAATLRILCGDRALESVALIVATALIVVPYTALRIAAEDRVLALAFGDAWASYTPRAFPRSSLFRAKARAASRGPHR